MPFASVIDPKAMIGRAPERLTIEERSRLAGMMIALAVYDPKTLPMRRIEAIGGTAEECMRQIAQRGLDPRGFEYQQLSRPY
jgi:hypothetical protein